VSRLWNPKRSTPVPADDGCTLAIARADAEAIQGDVVEIRAKVRGQWAEVLDRWHFTQERLDRNDIAGALERGFVESYHPGGPQA